MKWMTADETASGQPGALESAVPGDRLECVLGAGWGKPAARRQRGRNAELVTADEQSEHAAGHQEELQHGSPGTKDSVAPREQLRLKRLEAGGVGLATCLDNQIPRRLASLNLSTPELPQAPP
jgi:hypothetical protein